MSELSQAHDRFFRETFSRPEVVRSVLENYLPAGVIAALDLDTPAGTVARLETITDLDDLRHLLRTAATAESFADFEQTLAEVD